MFSLLPLGHSRKPLTPSEAAGRAVFGRSAGPGSGRDVPPDPANRRVGARRRRVPDAGPEPARRRYPREANSYNNFYKERQRLFSRHRSSTSPARLRPTDCIRNLPSTLRLRLRSARGRLRIQSYTLGAFPVVTSAFPLCSVVPALIFRLHTPGSHVQRYEPCGFESTWRVDADGSAKRSLPILLLGGGSRRAAAHPCGARGESRYAVAGTRPTAGEWWVQCARDQPDRGAGGGASRRVAESME
jgi:hypothetical protein